MFARLYPFILFIAAISSAAIGLAATRHTGRRGMRLFTLLMLSAGLWSFGRGMQALAVSVAAQIFWAKFQYIFIAALPVFWLLFSLDYTGQIERLGPRWRAALWILPVLTIVVAITNERHGLLWTVADPGSFARGSQLVYIHGAWFWIAVIYDYALILAGMIILLRAALGTGKANLSRSILLAAGAVAPLLGNLAYLTSEGTYDLTPVGFVITGIIYGWNILQFRFFDVVPIARSLLVDDLNDGVLVLDPQGQIVDVNRSARRILDLDNHGPLTGGDLAALSPAWARTLGQFGGSHSQGEVNLEQADYEVTASAIRDRSGRVTGNLFVIHDISVRKSAERNLLESEARFRTLMETAPDAMILTDTQGRIVQANRRVANLFGYQPDELAGQPMRRLIPAYPAAPWDEPRPATTDQITSPSATGHEMTGVHRDGRELSLALSYSPVITTGGVIYTNIVHDLMPLRQTEQQLRLQGQALNAAANGMVLTSLEGIVLWVNPAFTEITGYPSSEIIGKSTRILNSGVHPTEFYRDMWTTILSGSVWRGEIVNRRSNGSHYVESQTISPVFDAQGKITNFIAIKQDITEQKRAEEQIRQRARELAIINEIGQAAASNLEPDTLIQLVGDKIEQVFGAWMVYIALVDERTGLIEFPYYSEQGIRVANPGHLTQGQGLTSVVLREGKPLLIDEDYAEKADRLGAVLSSASAVPRPKTWIGVPIVSGEMVIGVLSVQNAEREHAYSEDDLRLLSTIAANLGVAIQNARLFQTEQERRMVAETLQQVSAAITASLRRDEVLDVILEQLKRVVHYDSASIMQWDEERALRVVAYAGFRDPEQKDFVPTQETAPYVWSVVTDKRHWLIPDTWNDPHWSRTATKAEYIRCWIGIPLIFKGEAIGLLNIDSEAPSAYTDRDIRIASLFADQAAIAIENARLYEKAQFEIGHRKQTELSLRETNRSLVQQIRENAALEAQLREQALRDPVTGLYNRRYLDESLPREIARAERENLRVGAIMIDLDFFKNINDMHGHISGDKALIALGHLLNARSRASDIACRFGGEEFCLILPGATPEAVSERAEELRAAFEAMVIEAENATFQVTISLGAAIYPLHADSARSLISRADQALYQAKRAGRNRVVVSGS